VWIFLGITGVLYGFLRREAMTGMMNGWWMSGMWLWGVLFWILVITGAGLIGSRFSDRAPGGGGGCPTFSESSVGKPSGGLPAFFCCFDSISGFFCFTGPKIRALMSTKFPRTARGKYARDPLVLCPGVFYPPTFPTRAHNWFNDATSRLTKLIHRLAQTRWSTLIQFRRKHGMLTMECGEKQA